jgi:uncharacterized protein (DUF697 family)
MENNKRLTGMVIHGFAVAHAATAFTLAQTIIGDEVALTALTVAMIVTIARINGADWSVSKIRFSIFAGGYLGTRGAVLLVKWIPGIGNVANATVTFAITETIGWVTYLIIQKGMNPETLSKEDATTLWEEAKDIREKEKEEMKKLYESMNPEDKKESDSLLKQLENEDLPDETKNCLISRLEAITSKYVNGDEQ